MRAMILAAGLGTRLRPLTRFRAKPALPVCGRPVISLLLELLSRHGVEEALINLHYLPQSIRDAVEYDRPPQMKITWSEEPTPLGTGGGIRRAADFLCGSPECLVLAGDMLLDIDLTTLLERHRASHRDVSLILRSDARGADFGTIGVDEHGRVVRIGKTKLVDRSTSSRSVDRSESHPASGSTNTVRSGETHHGLFTGVRFFSRDALTGWPDSDTFEDLRDWLAPRIEARQVVVGAEILDIDSSVWEPVGTPAEYLEVNLSPPLLPSLGGDARHWGGGLQSLPVDRGENANLVRRSVISASAHVPGDAELDGCVVWDKERVPNGFRGRDGVYAGNAFHPCGHNTSGSLL